MFRDNVDKMKKMINELNTENVNVYVRIIHTKKADVMINGDRLAEQLKINGKCLTDVNEMKYFSKAIINNEKAITEIINQNKK